MTTKVDAVIVGARCAGAATALLLARAGARVVVVDKGERGADTLSTHALMRGAILQLHRWRVLPAIVAAGTPPVRTSTFSYRDQDITVPIEPRFEVNALYAPRRTVLDQALVDAAVASGADVRYGTRVDGVRVDAAGRVRGIDAIADGLHHRIEADIVIGADGLYSTVAQRVGAPLVAQGQHAAGTLYAYWDNCPVDGYYWRFQTGGSVGAIPTNHGATCVYVSVPAARLRSEIHGDPAATYRRLVHEIAPEFDTRLDGAHPVEPVRGFGGHVGVIRRATGGGWALVGDAGYFKDPLTSHGITDALRDAELLARAIVKGTSAALGEYEATRNDLSQRLFDLTDKIASFDWTDAELQSLHRAFSGEMSREVRTLAGLGPWPRLLDSAPTTRVA